MKDFLADLALRGRVSASTQNQAFSAILGFCKNVLRLDWGELGDGVRAKRGKRLPNVFTPEEVARLLEAVSGTMRLILEVIYGGGCGCLRRAGCG